MSVWTTHDDIVVPADSARLAGATNLTVQSVCPADTIAHTGLPTDPDVESILLAELAAGPPPHADAGRLRAPQRPEAADQLVMSFVAKFAQAAPRKTAT